MRNSNSKKPATPNKHSQEMKVGARQEKTPGHQQGGGNPENCTNSEVSTSANLPVLSSAALRRELNLLALPPVWKAMLNIVDPEQFVQLWQLAAEHTAERDTNRLHVPSFRKFEVMQRNLFIRDLFIGGANKCQIRSQVKTTFGNISKRTITRVLKHSG